MDKKLRLCLALFMALAVLVQYSFTPQALIAYGLNNTDNAVQTEESSVANDQGTDEQKATEATEPTDATEVTEPADENKDSAADKIWTFLE